MCMHREGQTYLACNWKTEVKEKCYDIEIAEVRGSAHERK